MKRIQSFTNEKATLYVIATPIGNLKEISTRLIESINDCEAIFCEDTRVSVKILNSISIKKPLFSAYENVENSALSKIENYLINGSNVGLMSDAGYPGISDPGHLIIQGVLERGYNVVIVNGSNAAIHALLLSGFSTDHFYFYGFLNPQKGKRKKELLKLVDFEDTMIFYQSPHKLKECLEDFKEIFENRMCCITRELTKKFEEAIWGTPQELLEIADDLKGEMVLVVSGKSKEENVVNSLMLNEIEKLLKEGKKSNQAIKEVASKFEVSKNELYDYYLKEGKRNGK